MQVGPQREPNLEAFDVAEYLRCSNNNMPGWTAGVPLTEREQAEVNEALAVS